MRAIVGSRFDLQMRQGTAWLKSRWLLRGGYGPGKTHTGWLKPGQGLPLRSRVHDLRLMLNVGKFRVRRTLNINCNGVWRRRALPYVEFEVKAHADNFALWRKYHSRLRLFLRVDYGSPGAAIFYRQADHKHQPHRSDLYMRFRREKMSEGLRASLELSRASNLLREGVFDKESGVESLIKAQKILTRLELPVGSGLEYERRVLRWLVKLEVRDALAAFERG